jgi:hypothetical protein
VACEEGPDFHLVINNLEPAGALNWNLVFEAAVGISYIILAADVRLWYFSGM